MSREHDYLFKMAIIGNSSVGKSCILKRYADDTFTDSYLATIGVDFRFKTLMTDDKNVKLQIWDTAGQERFRTITSTYYKGAQCIFLVYDIHNKKSFEDVEIFWRGEIEKYGEKNVVVCLLGNKSDYQHGREVQLKQATLYAEEHKFPFFEVSAKTGDQITDAFRYCVQDCILRFPAQSINTKKMINEINLKKDNIKLAGGKETRIQCEC